MKPRIAVAFVLTSWIVWQACFGQAPTPSAGAPGKGLLDHVQDTMPPLGAIIAWHKDLAGPGELPRGWIECNGQKISYGPLTGKSAPDLNGERRFLRGGSTSGVPERDEFQSHSHRMAEKSDGAHEHPLDGVAWTQPQNVDRELNDNDRQNYSGFMKEKWPSHGFVRKTTNSGDHTHTIGLPADDKAHGEPRTGKETRPVNMSVVWIMRIE